MLLRLCHTNTPAQLEHPLVRKAKQPRLENGAPTEQPSKLHSLSCCRVKGSGVSSFLLCCLELWLLLHFRSEASRWHQVGRPCEQGHPDQGAAGEGLIVGRW